MKALLLWMVLSQGGDITTTAVGLHRGCVESWPYQSHPYVGMTLKGLGTVGLTLTLPRLKTSRPKLSKVLAIGVAIGGSIATAWNLHQLPRC